MAISLLALGVAAPGHATAAVFADNFNSNASHLDTTPTGWNLVKGTVDIIGNGFFDWYPGNGAYLDLDGSQGPVGQNSRIETTATYALKAGMYKFDLDYGINHNDGSDSDVITFGIVGLPAVNLFDANAADHSATSFKHTFTFVLLDELPFARFFIEGNSNGSSDQSGGIVDNFQVSAVPLPGAALFLVSGLLGIGGLGSLRRSKA